MGTGLQVGIALKVLIKIHTLYIHSKENAIDKFMNIKHWENQEIQSKY